VGVAVVLGALFVMGGYVLGVLALRRGLHDVRRIPRRVWRILGLDTRRSWQVGMVAGFAVLGWPGIAVVVAWRFSPTRAALREEWRYLSAEHRTVRSREPDIDLTVLEQASDESREHR
jgi:hypothetical protein